MYQSNTYVGNLGNDPQMSYFNDGTAAAQFNIAVNKHWTNPEGERQTKTTWIKIRVYGKQAEICTQHLSKGQMVLVDGELQEPECWTDKEGNAKATNVVKAAQVKFLTPKPESNGSQAVSRPASEIEAPF